MKTAAFVLLIVVAACLLPACQSGGAASAVQSKLSGTSEEILTKVNEDIAAAGVEMPMTLPPLAVTAENTGNMLGLSGADFEKYVASASSSMAAIGTFAHQLLVVEAVDEAAAAQVKTLLTGEGGYDANKWVCVHPEKAIAVESGKYVLLAAASADVCDAAVTVFESAAGSIGEVDTFWESEG